MNATTGALDPAERDAVAATFGVGDAQVVRDHVISHALAAIAADGIDDVVFFGGTALARTYLPDLRLSEDIDLIARGDRGAVGDRIERAVTSRLARAIGMPTFAPRIRETAHAKPSVMEVGGVRVQIQLLSSLGYPPWPSEMMDLHQRYSDAPPARMRVLTASAFAAAKLAAWVERAAARDLYDMWALATRGFITPESTALFGAYGPVTDARRVGFARTPSVADWESALSHQCNPVVGPAEAAAVVRDAWDAAAGAAPAPSA